jgi:hypothetical protein
MLKNFSNNLLIPVLDGPRENSNLVKSIKNNYISSTYLDEMLKLSLENLKDSPIFIREITDNIILKNATLEIGKDLNFSKVLNGEWSFDIAYFFSTLGASKGYRNSERVHHDSVGDRIKIFVGLDIELSETIFNRVWSYRLPRFTNYACDQNQRNFLEKKVSKIDYFDMKVDQKNFGVFNTNFVHQGMVGEIGMRNMIVIEASRNLKSKLLFGRIGKHLK